MASWIKTTDAAREADVSHSTILFWLGKDPSLGRKVGGRWRIDGERLSRIIEGTHTSERSR
jgi:hypothetical protein